MKPLDYFYDSPASGEGHFPQKFRICFLALVRLVFTPLFRYKAYGLEVLDALPKGTGFIVVGNHRSYLDPVFVMSVLKPRVIRFLAKEEFTSALPALARIVAWVGAFPVKRNTADMSAIKRAVRMLKRGEPVGIFPEGTRIRSEGQVPVYHEGAALVAQLAKAPVIPVRLWNTERICPPGKRLFRCPKVTLRFGEPLSLDEERFAALPKNERHAAFTQAVMERVYGMEFPPERVD
ncbi:MAG: 1-acyl-sn-glycerol-3-phosphate acyltransferase [Coriobacteriales bacterium]|jgi:1-acyl-sn-glycerol-3-phosphate acyltransferase|nr:1-acyl-sn-glycerol-3-phosphate acyltransferase [Coriobacteriales bacterium]